MEIGDKIYVRDYKKTPAHGMIFGYNEGRIISFSDKIVVANIYCNKIHLDKEGHFLLDGEIDLTKTKCVREKVRFLDIDNNIYYEKIPGDMERLLNDLEEKMKNYIGIIYENPWKKK